MSTFQAALDEFVQMQRIEVAAVDAQPEGVDLGEAFDEVCRQTQDAFDRVLALPAQSASQAAAKLAALSACYDVPACGCDRAGWAKLVAEVCRFSTADALRAGVA